MKTNLLTITLLLISISFFAQNIGNKTILLDSLHSVTTDKNYSYIRIIEDYKSDKDLYTVLEYYKSGKLSMTGFTNDKDILKFEGLRIDYYENGNKKQESNYTDNKLNGSCINYHKNGNKKQESNYIDNKLNGWQIEWYENNQKKSEKEITWDDKNKKSIKKIIQFWDKDGQQTIIDGNGQYEEISEKHSDTGNIKNGLKDGVWQGKYNTKYTYIEKYQKGELISGISTDKDKNEYHYTVLESKPEPIKGIQNFYQFIGKNFNIPKEYKSLNGKIYIRFIVDKEGRIVEPKIIKSLNETLDKEAIRVISSYEKWIPAKQRGQYVRVLYSLPITLKASK
ncbi:energy transducer TonB [Flavobacterium sp. ST-87]|uniref:Energy transducer TonB n=1 Tax=Flavobacterium plantiphilum TaxID=3163297 RepID=A0ABW8XTG9_9FLAO